MRLLKKIMTGKPTMNYHTKPFFSMSSVFIFNILFFLFCHSSNNVVAESALDRLACGLGGKTMLPHIVQNIPQMLENPDWKYRYTTPVYLIFSHVWQDDLPRGMLC